MKFKGIALFLISVITLSFLLLPPSSLQSQPREPEKIYKVAILPFLIHSQENLDYLREGIYDILASRMTVEGRIILVERSQLERALYEERPTRLDETVAARVGAKVGADYIILGSITKVGDYISLDARMISITQEKPPLGVFAQTRGIDDLMVKIGNFAQDIGTSILGRRAQAGQAGQAGRSYIQTRKDLGILGSGVEGLKKSQTFNFEVKGLGIGDVNGDKKNELVVMDRNNLYVFRYDGEKLNLLQKIEAAYGYNFLTLDVADVNRNGYAEIIVSAVVDDDVRSFILEYEEGRFRKITEKAGWFFRVLEHPREGPVLLGQGMDSEATPSGPIYQMVWKKKSYEKGRKIPFPQDAGIFGIAIGNLRGMGKLEYVFLDRFGRITITTEDGKSVWSGREHFGGTNNSYDTRKKKEEGYRPLESPPVRIYITGRILLKDQDGDGVAEIVVNKNVFATGSITEKAKPYEKAEVYSLSWEENRLIPNWKTREIKGYIADYQVKDIENKGGEDLVVALVLIEEGVAGTFSRKDESTILFFKIE